MSFTPTAASLAAVGTETLRELPMAAWMYGVIALASFVLLLGLLWSFRNTAAKHDRPVTHATGGHGDVGAQGSHGAADHGAHH